MLHQAPTAYDEMRRFAVASLGPGSCLLLVLAGLVAGCGASPMRSSAQPSGSTPTFTPTQGFQGTISEYALPDPDCRPGAITVGPDGNLWFTLLGTTPQTGKIGRITSAGIVHEFPLPPGSFSSSIAVGPDSNLWFKEPGKIAHHPRGHARRVRPLIQHRG